ncbi:MAG: helix-turn-helix domain-containing protein [Mailhella sp.]|nr:helix-turn-helix domain-containing protein [Mailhella sp.]
MSEIRKYYWNPRNWQPGFINQRDFLFTFNRNQPQGVWTTWHSHPTWAELAVVATGSGVFESSSGTYFVNNRQCVWIPPRITHDFYLLETSNNRTIFIDESVFKNQERFYRMQTIPLTPLLRELIFAVEEWHLDLALEADRRIGLALWETIKRSEEIQSSLVMPHDRRLQKICSDIVNNIDNNFSLEDWSKELGLSSKTLARLFVRETKMTFGRWMQKAKMDHARDMIEEGSSVTNAALSCGYSSISSFITVFKKTYGCTPGALSQAKGSQSKTEDWEHEQHNQES